MTYENAPATKLLCTSCACCGRPLLDAVSVQAGVGPICREKHGYTESQSEPDWDAYEATGVTELHFASRQLTARQLVNMLTLRVALDPNAANVPQTIVAIDALGFTRFASVLADRVRGATVVDVKLEPDRWGGLLVVTAPYSAKLTDALRAIPGRRWEAARKVNTIPSACANRLEHALKQVGATFVRWDGRLKTIGGR